MKKIIAFVLIISMSISCENENPENVRAIQMHAHDNCTHVNEYVRKWNGWHRIKGDEILEMKSCDYNFGDRIELDSFECEVLDALYSHSGQKARDGPVYRALAKAFDMI